MTGGFFFVASVLSVSNYVKRRIKLQPKKRPADTYAMVLIDDCICFGKHFDESRTIFNLTKMWFTGTDTHKPKLTASQRHDHLFVYTNWICKQNKTKFIRPIWGCVWCSFYTHKSLYLYFLSISMERWTYIMHTEIMVDHLPVGVRERDWSTWA